MIPWLTITGVALSAALSLAFSTFTYALRSFSRAKLAEQLERSGRSQWLDPMVDNRDDLMFVTAVIRLLANILILVFVMHGLEPMQWSDWLKYLVAVLIAGLISLFCSVAFPHAVSEHAGEKLISAAAPTLHGLRIALRPVTRLLHVLDSLVAKAVGTAAAETDQQAETQIQQEILSVVEEGAKEGIVDVQEQQMIESVIEFRAISVAQVMTARPDVHGLPVTATLEEIKQTLETTGHSRMPVYEGTLDHILGILYARDLLKHLGEASPQFDLRAAMRPAFYVPETKPLRDLLQDFRIKKVHLAVVLDEYGGTAGLVTIEDILEEIVGDISDEHEPHEPSMLRRIDERTWESDARIRLDELNARLELSLPEDAGYETLGGFVSNTMGRIPQAGSRFEHGTTVFVITDAEPQRVNRVRIELSSAPQPSPAAPTAVSGQ